MLTISEIATRYNISNRQVHDLVNYGYLNIVQVYRADNKGIKYLFSENEIIKLDIYSLLEEIKEIKKHNNRYKHNHQSDFKKIIRTANFYEKFIENTADYPEGSLLKVSFYLFHLNHYAKKYIDQSKELYSLKNRVLKKMYLENSSFIEASYLLGPDRNKIWLCEDCKDAARSAGMSYTTYIKEENYCPKCSIKSIEKEYYSLLEFKVDALDYRFTFHLPLSSALRWMNNIDDLPQGIRKIGKYSDKMYLYGRSINKIEEKIFPLPMIKEQLNEYINSSEA